MVKKQADLRRNYEVAKKCLAECPLRHNFTAHIEANKALVQELINDPKNNDMEHVNFSRGYLAALNNILKIPESIIIKVEELENKRQVQEKKRKSLNIKKLAIYQ